MEDLKKEALAEFLNEPMEDIFEEEYNTMYSNCGNNYLVLTEQEANNYVERQSREMLWTFYPSILARYMPDIGANAALIVELLQDNLFEASNEILYFLMKDNFDIFINDMIMEGRENIIDSYDGKEHEVHYKNNWLYIYQMD